MILSERKKVLVARAKLEQQFVTHQRHVVSHMRYLTNWYNEYRLALGFGVLATTAGLTYGLQKIQNGPPTSRIWLKWIRFGVLSLLDVMALARRYANTSTH